RQPIPSVTGRPSELQWPFVYSAFAGPRGRGPRTSISYCFLLYASTRRSLAILRAALAQASGGGADLSDAFLLDFALQARDQRRNRHGAEVALHTVAHGNGPSMLLLL